MRLCPEPAPSLPRFRSLLVHGPCPPSAPVHLSLSTPPPHHAVLCTPSRHDLLHALRTHDDDDWLATHAATGAVAAVSSRVTLFYPPTPQHLVAVLALLRTHGPSSPSLPLAPSLLLERAPTLLVLHEPSAYFLSGQQEHTVSSYLLLITHALSTIEYLSSQSLTSSPASLVVFDSQLDHLKLPVLRTPPMSAFDERDDPEDVPRPESVLPFVEKYFELSSTFQRPLALLVSFYNFLAQPLFQYTNNPSRTRQHYITSDKAWWRTNSLRECCSIIDYIMFVHERVNEALSSCHLVHNMPSESDARVSTFFSLVLKPGSSLHPSFLLAVDSAFAALFLVFAWSAYLTNGNVHFFILMAIEIALWASVKWFVQELRRLPVSDEVTQKKGQ